MKLKKWCAIGVLLAGAAAAHAAQLGNDVQVDVLMGKITSLMKANREADALPYFAQLETMGGKLPESFYFYYIDALDKSGDKEKTVSHAEDYLNRYGKQGKYYGTVVQTLSRVSIQLDEDNARKKAEMEKKAIADAAATVQCHARYKSKLQSARREVARAKQACVDNTYRGNSMCYGDNDKGPQLSRDYYRASKALEELEEGDPC